MSQRQQIVDTWARCMIRQRLTELADAKGRVASLRTRLASLDALGEQFSEAARRRVRKELRAGLDAAQQQADQARELVRAERARMQAAADQVEAYVAELEVDADAARLFRELGELTEADMAVALAQVDTDRGVADLIAGEIAQTQARADAEAPETAGPAPTPDPGPLPKRAA